MGRYFGTDGVRGVANKSLTAEMAFKIGSYLGYKYKKVVIGKDTRLSSSMLEGALSSGLNSYGADAYILGYTSTPCLAYNAMVNDFDCGVMISASHNPYYDNGIKIFSKNGLKISNDIEKEIEDYIDGLVSIERAKSEDIGETYDFEKGQREYAKWLFDKFHTDLKDLKVIFDLANGGACHTFGDYEELIDSSNITVINNSPNGLNINDGCGSTHLDMLINEIKKGDYDLGFAFDGDADRVLAIDEDGNVVDGDKIMYIIAKYLKSKGRLHDDTIVTTVMSNIGLYKAMDEANMKSIITAVGDKNVAMAMLKDDYSIGGEQSGHIIIKEDAMFGDGLKTALWLLKIISESGKSLKDLASEVIIYPQLLVNKKVSDKEAILKDEEVNNLISDISARLKNEGRILVRPSGTEPLIRVMVEAKTDEICHELVYEVIDYLASRGYLKE